MPADATTLHLPFMGEDEDERFEHVLNLPGRAVVRKYPGKLRPVLVRSCSRGCQGVDDDNIHLGHLVFDLADELGHTVSTREQRDSVKDDKVLVQAFKFDPASGGVRW